MEGNKNLSHIVPTWSPREPNELKKLKSSSPPNNKEKEGELEGHSNSKVDDAEETGRERLKRLREQVMKEKVNIPENWGQEQKLKDWIDYTMFDTFFAPHSLIVTARDALIANARKAKSPRLRI
ncbi:hypothetical protein VNO78_14024 [Psophocarpus tetragonolobus]|uniref:Uncharacterized protein n=1 Tax=Psophocarpus tetragonolobus TaxID=3891 RepID=A0AAN9SQR1_PSOTE